MADIHSKLAKVAGEIGSINKTERNEQQGFNFRSIEQITGAVRPLLAAEGVSVLPRVLSKEYSEVTSKTGTKGYRCIVEVEYTFTAGSDGSSAVASMVGEAADYGDKATSKAVQMAYKYALTQVLQVGSGDDPDAHSVDVGGYEESKRPRSGGRKLTPSPQSSETPQEAPRTNGNDPVAEHARKMVLTFVKWTPDEQADSYKRHSKTVLGGKATQINEVDQVVTAMAEEYFNRFPDEVRIGGPA